LIKLDWKTHENNYYECSKYRGQPQSQLETRQSRAREALKKYLHYFERVSEFDLIQFNRMLVFLSGIIIKEV
jgi:hypothetical protein